MRYDAIAEGVFLDRPNRFIARCRINGAVHICHVKNTGRCRELLVPGRTVYLDYRADPSRKTAWDLVAVQKGDRLINMDSAAPNRAVAEWLSVRLPPDAILRPEFSFGRSRVDFYVQTPARRLLLEVKGVTLEENGIVLFPDAPTQRGVKHLRELTAAVQAGYEAAVLFVIQMEHVRLFTPNRATHPAFAQALLDARAAGVRVEAYDCTLTPDSMVLRRPVPVQL